MSNNSQNNVCCSVAFQLGLLSVSFCTFYLAWRNNFLSFRTAAISAAAANVSTRLITEPCFRAVRPHLPAAKHMILPLAPLMIAMAAIYLDALSTPTQRAVTTAAMFCAYTITKVLLDNLGATAEGEEEEEKANTVTPPR